MYIKTYRKIPESVQALQLSDESADAAARWTGGRKIDEVDPFDSSKTQVGMNIPTLSGVVRASAGDYILQAESGGFSILSSENFEAQYERPSR